MLREAHRERRAASVERAGGAQNKKSSGTVTLETDADGSNVLETTEIRTGATPRLGRAASLDMVTSSVGKTSIPDELDVQLVMTEETSACERQVARV
ncbi:hypothetical protein PHYPSEUDO_008730 [Phytophthora pseudosyringae]|uniref:Uncharacterized protein n=1 Tax=Phytophthora pseudosyringae TaxID=221518 RepID=A0A8T1VGN6_9STRA|nr:hypothetical protein PHYPSEUDO_008730 [Phytophthora pseudosyringae]